MLTQYQLAWLPLRRSYKTLLRSRCLLSAPTSRRSAIERLGWVSGTKIHAPSGFDMATTYVLRVTKNQGLGQAHKQQDCSKPKRAFMFFKWGGGGGDDQHCVTDSDTMWMKFTLVTYIFVGIIFGCAKAQFVDNFVCPDEFEGYYPHLYSCDR